MVTLAEGSTQNKRTKRELFKSNTVKCHSKLLENDMYLWKGQVLSCFSAEENVGPTSTLILIVFRSGK